MKSALLSLPGLALAIQVSVGALHAQGSGRAASCQPSWLPPFAGGAELNERVHALAVFDDGSGPALYAGGRFTRANGNPCNRLARWNGEGWEPLGNGLTFAATAPEVSALAVFDDGRGAGPALYAGGLFARAGTVTARRIAKWDGASWSALGEGMMPTGAQVSALAVHDDGRGRGPSLFAGGDFTSAGGVPTNHVAKWDGVSWAPLGGGTNGRVTALAVFDDGQGGGPALYASGLFTAAGGVPAHGIARWDGVSWSALGGGIPSPVGGPLAVYDGGGGPALYIGGLFSSAGGTPARSIARWNGTSWSPLGSGISGSVLALAVFDDGSGSALYAGGFFTIAGGVAAHGIARWNGARWSPVGDEVGGAVAALTVFGGALHAGGDFTDPASGPSYLARWKGCADSAPPRLDCPEAVVVGDRITGPPGEVVAFSVTAHDNRDPAPLVVCEPPSGSWFPQGTTLVHCTATDASGNESTCAFPVVVQPKARRR